ncbi:MAG: methylenetetrahydrofolate reductase C-terminal domain-containing protein [Candidatus Aminicenantes bacterium]|nr:methylenetetrahydrofolate reductase C-terminal domain-containing protein [Candidatus Aminicenantes bacterium]
MSRSEKAVSKTALIFENVVKIPFFRCQRCGECILSHTAFICSQRCPKRLRNGPCGGTGRGGTCEVYPEQKCVWYRIYKRARFLRRLFLLTRIEKIHNWNLEKTSAWMNVLQKRIEAPILFLKRKK